MLAVLTAVGADAQRDRAWENLLGPEFQTQSVRLDAVTATIRAVVIGNGRLDAIVLPFDHFADHWPGITVAREIRSLDDRLSFRGAVKAKTTPIVFLAERHLQTRLQPGFQVPLAEPPQVSEIPWCGYVDVLTTGSIELPDAVFSVVLAWREALIRELDFVGYVVSLDAAGRVTVNHALRRKRRESELLADEATPGSLRAAQYLILAEDFLQTFNTYDELKFLIENYESARVYRRAHYERGWLRCPDPASIPPSCVNAPFGWSLTMPTSIRPSGRRCDRSLRS